VLRRFLDSGLSEIRILSRDEKKQDDMRKRYNHAKLKFYIGDVREPRCDLSYAKFVGVGEQRITQSLQLAQHHPIDDAHCYHRSRRFYRQKPAAAPGVVIWDDVLPRNSWGEAKVSRAHMQANGWRTALVVRMALVGQPAVVQLCG
jgi:hypothetical protein